MPDIDIDLANRDFLLSKIQHIPASMVKGNVLVKHNVGVYLHNIPTDPISNMAAIPYKEAEQLGYFKFDFLNVQAYGLDKIKNEDHLIELVNKEPMWEILEDKELCDQLFHVNGHFEIVDLMKPRTVEQLAMTLAVIRPGKRHLLGKSWFEIEEEIWKPTQEYYFKHSHAISYAIAIVVQMNLMVENVD